MPDTGRPSKLTPATKEKVLQALGLGNTRAHAAAYAGIDDATLRRWMVRGRDEKEGSYAELRQSVLEAESRAQMMATGCIAKAIRDGDWKAGCQAANLASGLDLGSRPRPSGHGGQEAGRPWRGPRTKILATLRSAAEARMSEEHVAMCESSDDALDAFVAALIARAFALELCEQIPEMSKKRAEREGWIAVPLRDSLHRLRR